LTFVGIAIKLEARQLHCVSKKRANFDSSFDKHGLILIIFGQQHQHTFKNDMHIQLFLCRHFYLPVQCTLFAFK